MRTLILGHSGLLGPYLVRSLNSQELFTTSRHGGSHPADLSDDDAVRTILEQTAPDAVLLASGLTNVDACERNPAEALRQNRDAPANVARHLPSSSRLVFLSTDQVYPDEEGPHPESAARPVNAYGRSKRAGELAVLEHANALVLRVNFFCESLTPGRRSLSDFFLDGLRANQSVPGYSDVLFSPLHATTLSKVVGDLILRPVTGCLNVGSRDGVSKLEFGRAVARRFGLDESAVRTVHSAATPGTAPRPHDMRMDVSRIESILGVRMPSLQQEVERL